MRYGGSSLGKLERFPLCNNWINCLLLSALAKSKLCKKTWIVYKYLQKLQMNMGQFSLYHFLLILPSTSLFSVDFAVLSGISLTNMQLVIGWRSPFLLPVPLCPFLFLHIVFCWLFSPGHRQATQLVTQSMFCFHTWITWDIKYQRGNEMKVHLQNSLWKALTLLLHVDWQKKHI